MNETTRDLIGQSSAEVPLARLGRFRLLSIGINRYVEWPRLETAVAGAVGLADLLGRDYGFEGARTLTDGEATRAAITGELARLVDEAEPEDSVVIYFAGHGHIDPRTQTGSWIPVDAVADRTGQRYEASATWLSNSVVKDHLKACKARHVLLISDSCFAGDFLRSHREAPPVIDDAYVRRSFQQRSRLALTAGGVQPVVDSGLPGQSVFTGFLLHALSENDRPWYLPSELHVRIRSGVAANAPQQPLLGRLQDTGGAVDGEFVFFRRGYASLEMALEENRRRLDEAMRLRESQEASRRKQLDEVAAKKAELAEKERQLAELRKQSEALKSPAERASGLDQILGLLSEIEERHEELKRREAELAEARRVEEARLEAERKQRLAEARKRFEAEKGKYEKVLASPFADEGMKRTAWQLFCQSQGVTVRDPEKPGRLEWGEEAPRETVERPAIAKVSAAPPPKPSGPRRVTLADIQNGFEGRIGDILTVEPGLEFCWIPAGEFVMGSPAGYGDKDENPQTEVTISRPFWMGRVPLRQRDWTALTGDNPSHFKGEDLPVENVLWDECVALGDSLTGRLQGQLPAGYQFRLPTEAEWEYAARAGTRTAWFFGEHKDELEVYAWFDENSEGKTHPVGLKLPNPWGLHDVYGNVWEWCGDWKEAYPGGRVRDPVVGPEGRSWFQRWLSFRVFRGGSWSVSAGDCRSAYRFGIDFPGYRWSNLGFRLVLAPRSVF
jgi:formylglycine-generating enzyme required for sulfatase activity